MTEFFLVLAAGFFAYLFYLIFWVEDSLGIRKLIFGRKARR